MISMPVISTRARMNLREAVKAVSSESPKRSANTFSWPKASTVSRPSRPSLALPMASAKRSCAVLDSRRSRRAEMNRGARPTGISTMISAEKCGLTASSRMTEPVRLITHRSAIGAETPTIRSTMVMSVVIRDSSSPVLTCTTWATSSIRMCR